RAGLTETKETIAMTIAVARKKTPLVIKALPLSARVKVLRRIDVARVVYSRHVSLLQPRRLEPEPYARAQLQVMRRKQSARKKNKSFRAIENRSPDIDPHGISICRIEPGNPADI